VILLHGGPEVPMDFSPVAEQLSQNIRLLHLTNAERPFSAPGATYSINEYLKDLDAIAQHLGCPEVYLAEA